MDLCAVDYLWVIVMFLSDVWTLIQHPFTAEDPTFLQSDEETTHTF